jgi:hypothetical protein
MKEHLLGVQTVACEKALVKAMPSFFIIWSRFGVLAAG